MVSPLYDDVSQNPFGHLTSTCMDLVLCMLCQDAPTIGMDYLRPKLDHLKSSQFFQVFILHFQYH